MKRKRFLFEQIIDYDNLRLAWIKARRGKSNKPSVMSFSQNVDYRLKNIRQRFILDNPFCYEYTQFKVYDPKERVISVVPFEERVMHHAIMNVLEPVFESHFIYHTYACRKNKGTHRAVKYACKKSLQTKYYLKLDVRKYFDCINHTLLKNMLRRIIKDTQCLNILNHIIDSYYVEDVNKGLPIGNLTSQFFANFYLSVLDHFIIETLKPSGYLRYMDDMLIFCNEKKQIVDIYKKINEFCTNKLDLRLKEPVIGYCNRGITFLGYKFISGKVDLSSTSKKRKKDKLKVLNLEFKNGLITETEYMNRVKCMYSVSQLLLL